MYSALSDYHDEPENRSIFLESGPRALYESNEPVIPNSIFDTQDGYEAFAYQTQRFSSSSDKPKEWHDTADRDGRERARIKTNAMLYGSAKGPEYNLWDDVREVDTKTRIEYNGQVVQVPNRVQPAGYVMDQERELNKRFKQRQDRVGYQPNQIIDDRKERKSDYMGAIHDRHMRHFNVNSSEINMRNYAESGPRRKYTTTSEAKRDAKRVFTLNDPYMIKQNNVEHKRPRKKKKQTNMTRIKVSMGEAFEDNKELDVWSREVAPKTPKVDTVYDTYNNPTDELEETKKKPKIKRKKFETTERIFATPGTVDNAFETANFVNEIERKVIKDKSKIRPKDTYKDVEDIFKHPDLTETEKKPKFKVNPDNIGRDMNAADFILAPDNAEHDRELTGIERDYDDKDFFSKVPCTTIELEKDLQDKPLLESRKQRKKHRTDKVRLSVAIPGNSKDVVTETHMRVKGDKVDKKLVRNREYAWAEEGMIDLDQESFDGQVEKTSRKSVQKYDPKDMDDLRTDLFYKGDRYDDSDKIIPIESRKDKPSKLSIRELMNRNMNWTEDNVDDE